jgi:hypothetical protein
LIQNQEVWSPKKEKKIDYKSKKYEEIEKFSKQEAIVSCYTKFEKEFIELDKPEENENVNTFYLESYIKPSTNYGLRVNLKNL